MALGFQKQDVYTNVWNILRSLPPFEPLMFTPEMPAIIKRLADRPHQDNLKLELPSTLPERALDLVELPTNLQLSPIGMLSEYGHTTTTETPIIKLDTLGSGDKAFDIWRSIHGNGGTSDLDLQLDYQKYIDRAATAEMGAGALNIIGSLTSAAAGYQYRKDVEATKSQYETQKKIIDANINKTETALMDNLMENMANLDVVTAAKNVDIFSQAKVGDKTKGAMDLGKDIADMRTNGALQKAALDLQYAMNVKQAKRQEWAGYFQSGAQIVGTALSFL